MAKKSIKAPKHSSTQAPKTVVKKEPKKEPKKKGLENFNLLPHQEHPLVCSKEFKTFVYGSNIPIIAIQKYKLLWKNIFTRSRNILVHMFLRNGKKTQFIINPIKPYFEFQGGVYVIDKDAIIEDIGSGYSELIYDQAVSLPKSPVSDISKRFDDIKKDPSTADLWYNMNPYVLAQTVDTVLVSKLQANEEGNGKMIALMFMVGGNLFFTLMLMVSVGMMMFG